MHNKSVVFAILLVMYGRVKEVKVLKSTDSGAILKTDNQNNGEAIQIQPRTSWPLGFDQAAEFMTNLGNNFTSRLTDSITSEVRRVLQCYFYPQVRQGSEPIKGPIPAVPFPEHITTSTTPSPPVLSPPTTKAAATTTPVPVPVPTPTQPLSADDANHHKSTPSPHLVQQPSQLSDTVIIVIIIAATMIILAFLAFRAVKLSLKAKGHQNQPIQHELQDLRAAPWINPPVPAPSVPNRAQDEYSYEEEPPSYAETFQKLPRV